VKFVGELDAGATLAKYGTVPLRPTSDGPPTRGPRALPDGVRRARRQRSRADRGTHFHTGVAGARQTRARGSLRSTCRSARHVQTGRSDDLADHPMHAECYRVSGETAELINGRTTAGGRVWAVGTRWSVRSKPCGAGRHHPPGAGDTSLFIYPPYTFRAVDRCSRTFTCRLDAANVGVRVRGS